MNHHYNAEENKFLIDNVKGITLKELTEKFNNKFNLNLSESAIANRKTKLGLTSGIVGGQFKKGNVPFNKGTKGLMKPNKTSFKKGNVPANRRPIGSERKTKDGYIEIKINDGKLNKNWMCKHRYVYQKHYGKIPEGYNVVFLDGDKNNCNISNLEIISKAEDLIMNQYKLFTKNKDLTKIGLSIAKVVDKTNELKNKKMQKEK